MEDFQKNSVYQFDEESIENDIAVIGMSLRVPGANEVETFWQNLHDGKESFTPLSDEELLANGVPQKLIDDPNYVKITAPIANMKQFDASFFGISAKDATLMDPQHRHFLELSWEALEHASCDPGRYDGSIGVFAGSGQNTYLIWNLMSHRGLLDNPGFWYLRHAGNDKDFLTTRLSYHLDLQGPSINLQTACSTSLVAIHMACQALLNRECDLTLAGGSTIIFPDGQGYLYQEGGIQSPDGHCRSFDAESKGTVFSSGAGIVVLKRLEDALRDRDTIHGVIKASAVNNDGSQKAGFTAPSVDGQAAAISEALSIGDIDPETIGYVEAHGTATPIGDPIEISAMTQAWSALTQKKNFCAVSSLKSNIGHLDTAAGVASFVKAVGVVKNGHKYPTVHFHSPNPTLGIEETPFYMNGELEQWDGGEQPRRAAISSLGVGGTNAHVIVEQLPERSRSISIDEPQLLVLSARTPTALEQMRANMAEFVSSNPDTPLSDIAFTLWSGRKQFDHRCAIWVTDRDHAVAALKGEIVESKVQETATQSAQHKVVLMCTGQGAQYPGMAKPLYQSNQQFRTILDQAATVFLQETELNLLDIVFAESADTQSEPLIARTEYAQPALFAIEYAVAKLWQSVGVEFDYLIGHSIGEYVAACLAGVFDFTDALRLVILRGRLMQSLPEGSMLAVGLEEPELKKYLSKTINLAAINAPGVGVISGPGDQIESLATKLDQQGIVNNLLHTSHAFHSSMMDPILSEFEQAVAKCQQNIPNKPFISNLTGDWIKADQATDPAYWSKHLRSTVLFAKGVSTLLNKGESLACIEVGPGKTLSQLFAQYPSHDVNSFSIPSLPGVRDITPADDFFRLAFGHLWTFGFQAPWQTRFDFSQAMRIPLPTYPFERQEFWVPAVDNSTAEEVNNLEKQEFSRWFYQPSWRKQLRIQSSNDIALSRFVVVGSASGFSEELCGYLQGEGARVSQVGEMSEFTAALAEKPTHILDFSAWSIAEQKSESVLETCFYHLMERIKAIIENEVNPLHYVSFSLDAQIVNGQELNDPLIALQTGPLRSLLTEGNGQVVSRIDIDTHQKSSIRLLSQIVMDLQYEGDDFRDIAFRANQRYLHEFEPLILDCLPSAQFISEGVYVITGGLGGLGLSLAEQLAESFQAKVALLSRRSLPPRDTWESSDDLLLNQLLTIEKHGQLLVIQVDTSRLDNMRSAFNRIIEKFGAINGVIHTAGIIEDELLVLKSRENAQRVIAPKVQGTQVLDKLWDEFSFDFLLLYSSVSALAGAPGQADYTAANAYLDAYANWKAHSSDKKVISVNWNTWRDVGMSIEMAVAQGLVETEQAISGNSFYEIHRTTKAKENHYLAHISVAKNWILDEHRTSTNLSLVPGTGYIDLVYSAYQLLKPCQTVEIKNLFFMSPVTISEGVEEVLATRIEMGSEEPEFVIATATSVAAAKAQQWNAEHVRGTVRVSEKRAPSDLDISVVKSRCEVEYEILSGVAKHEHLIWGDRWKCVERIDYGVGECLIELNLDPKFSDDFGIHPLHPALLDMAIGGQKLIPDFDPAKDFFVPVSYGTITIYGPLKNKLWSHVKFRADSQASTPEFDVIITDDTGQVILSVTQFVMKQVEFNALDQLDAQAPSSQDQVAPHVDPGPLTLFEQGIQAGISAEEGFKALQTILSLPVAGQFIVSSQNLPSLLRATKESLVSTEPEEENAFAVPRPNLSTEFVAPSSQIEDSIEKIWRVALGVEKVGIHDNFFEFGGHSLLLTQIIARLRKKLNVNLPMGSLFDRSTIAEWAALIDEHEPGEEIPEVVPLDRSLYAVNYSDLQIEP